MLTDNLQKSDYDKSTLTTLKMSTTIQRKILTTIAALLVGVSNPQP